MDNPIPPETQPTPPEAPPTGASSEPALVAEPLALTPETRKFPGLHSVFIGSQGLRAGWSVSIFLILTILFALALGAAAHFLVHNFLRTNFGEFTPMSQGIGEAVSVLSILGAAAIVALLERRRVLDYNLIGPNRTFHFLGGLVAGFAALSILIGALALGGWLHFGPVALAGSAIFKFAAEWGLVFLLVGLFEEGAFRCYLQFTLTRGINFWWAIALVTAMCVGGFLATKGHGVWGVYLIALLGLVPCLLLHLNKVPGSNFWQAAWVTSTLFGFIHTGNNGENWIGIFAAAAIGFVFCVSIRVTGSAWWAIGCHAAWDWAETYFYGAADSGNVATGHLLSTSPAGAVLWSGGTDGPEGSLLVLGVILLLLVALLAIYSREKPTVLPAPELTQTAG
jgi:membrane protease YdiL (CAAX protease family)